MRSSTFIHDKKLQSYVVVFRSEAIFKILIEIGVDSRDYVKMAVLSRWWDSLKITNLIQWISAGSIGKGFALKIQVESTRLFRSGPFTDHSVERVFLRAR